MEYEGEEVQLHSFLTSAPDRDGAHGGAVG